MQMISLTCNGEFNMAEFKETSLLLLLLLLSSLLLLLLLLLLFLLLLSLFLYILFAMAYQNQNHKIPDLILVSNG